MVLTQRGQSQPYVHIQRTHTKLGLVYLGFLDEVWLHCFPALSLGSPFFYYPFTQILSPLSLHVFLSSCLGTSSLFSLAHTSVRPFVHALALEAQV